MGTEISLDVGGLTVDWSKNTRGNDHGMLFQHGDRKRIRSDQINYEYFKEIGEEPESMEMAFCRPLKEMVSRLELLGFTLDNARQEYMTCVETWKEDYLSLADEGKKSSPDIMTFDEYCSFIKTNPIENLDETFISSSDSESRERVRGRFVDSALIRRLPYNYYADNNAYSELSYFAGLISFMHPYSILRLLSECESNINLEVIWQYGPLVDAGWASEDEFTPGARRSQVFLIATEGSSDTHILKHALSLLRPEIEDFFQFIDVSERHPFPGTGNLLKFAEGLIKIDIQNKIVLVFDNDAEGVDAYSRLLSWKLPSNMRAMVLPTLEEFRSFPARGPDGVANADINGRAAAIECYLDLNLEAYPRANVIWTNYKNDMDVYQGSLEYKESYTKAFLKQTVETVNAGKYSVDNLRIVLDSLVTECCTIAKNS